MISGTRRLVLLARCVAYKLVFVINLVVEVAESLLRGSTALCTTMRILLEIFDFLEDI